MHISVKVGEKAYGGYPWEKYDIMVAGRSKNRKFVITFINEEKDRVYGPSWGEGEPTSNTEGEVELSRRGARALYHLLGSVLLYDEEDVPPWAGMIGIDESEKANP